jgi:hypothetical protein
MLDVVLPGGVVRAIVGDLTMPFLLGAAEAQHHAPGIDWPDLALAPLWTDVFLEGFISVREPGGGEHTMEEVLRLLAGISYQAAVALERARSFESLEDTFVSTVEALANALEANDEYTSSHTRWITDMALKVGEKLGFDPPALKRLELGALFHDIGKIGIPTSILLKPGPLTEEERKIIEMHPSSERIRADRTSSPRCARSCAAATSAGTARGYPDGTSGEDPRRGQDRARLRCLPRDDDRPALPQAPGPGRGVPRRLREGTGTQFDFAVVEGVP